MFFLCHIVELFFFFVFRIRCPVRKPGIFPPAELCCSVVAARRPTDLPTLFRKVGIAVSLRVFYTTGFIFSKLRNKMQLSPFPAGFMAVCGCNSVGEGNCGCVSGWVVFGETGSFVADGLKNPGFSEAEDMVGESTASGVVQCPVQPDWSMYACRCRGWFCRSDNKRKATEFAGLYGIGNIESSVKFSANFWIREEMKKSPGGLCQDQFFELFHLSLKSLVRFDLVRYRLAGVQHRGVVASSDSRTDGDQRDLVCCLARYGDLTRLSHFAGSFGRIEALDVDMQEVADDFDDVLDC